MREKKKKKNLNTPAPRPPPPHLSPLLPGRQASSDDPEQIAPAKSKGHPQLGQDIRTKSCTRINASIKDFGGNWFLAIARAADAISCNYALENHAYGR